MLAKLYRKFIPQNIRKNIYRAFLGKWLLTLRNYVTEPLKAKYYTLLFFFRKPRNEEEKALHEWAIVGPCPYPYLWVKEYRNGRAFALSSNLLASSKEFHLMGGGKHLKNRGLKDVHVYYQNNLPYVLHNGQRLFFKKGMSAKLVRENYLGLLIEQDKRSAHCYVSDYSEMKGRTLLDVGSAEGIFTLDTIEHIRHAYLFESEDLWIEALHATFEPWKEKITIVKKYVSDTDDEQNLCLDTFFRDKPTDHLFLKMDIEGYERKALNGARHLLATAESIAGAVCIYHKKDDPQVIGQILTDTGMTFEQTPGYLYMSRELRPGVIRFTSPAKRNTRS